MARTETRSDVRRAVRGDRRRKEPARLVRGEDTQSGDVSLPLVSLSAGTRVTAAAARVSGQTFHGRLRDLEGARVTESNVVYNAPAPGTHSGFIVDFGGSLSVLGVSMTDGSGIVLLLPWLGTDFSPRPAWPAGDQPIPASAGAATVNLTGIETQKLFVQLARPPSELTEGLFAAACRITTGTPPSNLRASVGGRPPFWTHPGVLADEVEIAGLEAELNALALSEPGSVSLDVSTDTPGVLSVAVTELAVSQTATASWAGKPSTSVALTARASTAVPLPFPGVSGLVRGVELALEGTFPRWRAVTVGTDDAPGRLSMKVNARFAVARCLPFAAPTAVYGVSMLVGPSAGALHLELLSDLAAAKPLAVADVDVDAAHAAWLDVMFSSAIDVPAGEMWLVAMAKTGTIEWIGTTVPDESAGPDTLAYVSSEGGRWERYPALGPVTPTTQVRLLRLPTPTDSTPLVTVAWPDGDGKVAGVNVDDETTTVIVPRVTPLDVDAVEILVTAAATGTLAIKSATAIF